MAKGRLEHANITVSDIERTSRLLQDLLGWEERWRGPALNGGETIHVGEEFSYIAVYRLHRSPNARTLSQGDAAQSRGIACRRSRRGGTRGQRSGASAVQSCRLPSRPALLFLRLGRN